MPMVMLSDSAEPIRGRCGMGGDGMEPAAAHRLESAQHGLAMRTTPIQYEKIACFCKEIDRLYRK